MEHNLPIIVERHENGFTAYPLTTRGIVIGQGDTEALADVESAIKFHVETFGPAILEEQDDILDASLHECKIAV